MKLAVLLDTLPARNTGRGRRPGDPWNLLFLGPEESVIGALQAAGWVRLSLSIPVSILQGLGQLLRGRRLTLFPPMNIYHLDRRPQDHNWAQVVRPLAERHHFRLWRLPHDVWWGSANYDRDIRYRDLSHIPDPDADAERDYIAATLEGSPGVESIEYRTIDRIPTEGANDKGYPFRTDRRVLIVKLKTA
ncbi:MAG: LssY C-terminal domain-containing protein [Elusimicrobiota bacterium]